MHIWRKTKMQKYIEAELEIVEFEVEDIITTSSLDEDELPPVVVNRN